MPVAQPEWSLREAVRHGPKPGRVSGGSREAIAGTSGAPVEEHGPYSAMCETVQMDGIFQDGFHTPLTTTQVAGLFHAGCLSRHARGSATEEAEGQMIDDLLPLLKYRTSRQFTR